MSFLSYNLGYYRKALAEIEKSDLSEDVYRAKQLLKFVEDIADEGYPRLLEAIEENFDVATRLRRFVAAHGEEPFPVRAVHNKALALPYGEEKEELTAALCRIEKEAQNAVPSSHAFIGELRCFTDWLGDAPDTTYLFLLRDTLLSYLTFRKNKKSPAVPWLFGRKMMWDVTGEKDSDDVCLREVINEALEAGKTETFEEFRAYCTPRMKENLKRYPRFETEIKKMLSAIPTEKITVIDSGCYGSFPMMLCALDSRADMKMYTSIPQLVKTYGSRLYTPAYEQNRWFETLLSQDALIRYAGYENGRFTVSFCTDAETVREAEGEIAAMLGGKASCTQ